MSIRLTVKMRGEQGGADKAQVVMLDDDVVTLGREAERCQVVLGQHAVSRTHARISRDGTLFFVEDLGSSYGTQINGQKLPKGEKRLLRNGDTIAIAQFDVTFDRVAEVSVEDSGNTRFSKNLVKDVMKGLTAGGEKPYFRVMNGAREGQRIEVNDAQEYVFGRDEEADIQLQDDMVSRRHAKVRRDWSGTHLEDLGSRNGIKVNKKKVKKVTLKDRDEVEIGHMRLLFIDPTEVRETPVVVASTEEEHESTVSVAEDLREPEPPPPEPEPEPQPDPEPPADSPANTAESDPPASEEPPAEEEPLEEEPADEGPRKLIDFSNKQTVVVLAVVGVMVLLALVLIILLIVGA
jgi:pSer/pThr/pTyr-binding forkhead associated (FHA) protein